MKKRQCKEEADRLRAIRKQESAKKMTEGRREESPVHAEKVGDMTLFVPSTQFVIYTDKAPIS